MRRIPLNRTTMGCVVATLALAAGVPASAAVFAFTGVYTNTTPPPGPSPDCAVGEVFVNFSPATATTTGTSNFGSFGPTVSHCIRFPPPTSYTGGQFSFAFDAGDELFGTLSAAVTFGPAPGFLQVASIYEVTGGTGRFYGASGILNGDGIVDRTGAIPFNTTRLSGDLSLPAVPEPATWALMIMGFGLAGSVLRGRRGEERPSSRNA